MKVVLMMTAGVAGLVAIILSPGLGVWLGVGSLAVVSGAVYWFGRCSHPGPLALLPATQDMEGNMLTPRWYCDGCGLEWPAHFEKDATPIQRFSGYDESKAVSAAKRQEELRDRQRLAALERAGLRVKSTPRKVSAQQVHAHTAHSGGGVVQIGSRRSVAH
jgi:hypothetical protein